MRFRHPIALAALVLSALTASRPAHAAWSTSALVNNPIRISPTGLGNVNAVSDGAGGVFVGWIESNPGPNYRAFVTHLLSTGDIDARWPAAGRAVSTTLNGQTTPQFALDGAGGVYVAWTEARSGGPIQVYCQRFTVAGVPSWPDTGIRVSNRDRASSDPHVVADNSGGVLIAWLYDYGAADVDVLGARLTSTGALAPGWTAGGHNLDGRSGIQNQLAATTDNAGGLWVAYSNDVTGSVRPSLRRIGPGGTNLWGTDNVRFAGLLDVAVSPKLCTDGGSGVYMTWEDYSTGVTLTWAQHFEANGQTDYDLYGDVIASAATSTAATAIVPDGTGGAFVALNADGTGLLYRLQPALGVSGAWPASVGLLTNVVVADGSGGAYGFWQRSPNPYDQDIVGLRYTAAGVLASGWTYPGTFVADAGGAQLPAAGVADGEGNAIVVFTDKRRGQNASDLYAQRIDRFGALGDVAPRFTSIRDVRGDQGGSVRLQWNACTLDGSEPGGPVTSYTIWRQAPATLAANAQRAGATRLGAIAGGDAIAAALSGGGRVLMDAVTAAYAWEYVGSQAAIGSTAYSYVATTTRDSLPGSNPYTVFMVRAQGPNGAYWATPPDSGYSVDNLPPLAPAALSGAYAGGATHLAWGANGEPDLAGYRVYRGTNVGFVPSPANRVVETGTTAFTDAPGVAYVYKVTAIDLHGNESAASTLVPAGTTGVDGVAPRELSFAGATPHPLRTGGAFRFALPRPGRVSLALFDQQGRHVRTLLDAERAAGEQVVAWDGGGADGAPIAPGMYFARLEAEGRSLVRRVAIVR